MNKLRVRGRPRLEPTRKAGLFEHEVLHEPEHGGPERKLVVDTVDGDRFGNARAADVRASFVQGDVGSAAREIVRGHETVDAASDDGDRV